MQPKGLDRDLGAIVTRSLVGKPKALQKMLNAENKESII